jgi:DNA (cytosine-5)-methyltransferase 1
LRELSLFTGIGGGLLGSMLLGWEPVQFVERDAYCKRVLGLRFPDVPIHDDVSDFHPEPGSADIVTAGFPCQPFSQAGKRLGAADERNGWPHSIRILRESRAPLFFGENVPGLLSSGYFGTILGDLAEAGFDAEWCVLGADDVGAPHRRKRLWILAYRQGFAVGTGLRENEPTGIRRGRLGDTGSPWRCDPADVPHPDRGRCQGQWVGRVFDRERTTLGDDLDGRDGEDGDDWLAEPYVGRVAHGVPSRVDRLRGLGNAQVPQSMAAAFTILAARAGLTDVD